MDYTRTSLKRERERARERGKRGARECEVQSDSRIKRTIQVTDLYRPWLLSKARTVSHDRLSDQLDGRPPSRLTRGARSI